MSKTNGSDREIGAIQSTMLLTFGELALTVLLVGQNRYLAGQIGPSGFGVFGLLQSVFRFVSAASSSWLSLPLTKMIAQYDAEGNQERVNNTFSISLGVTLVLFSVFGIIIVSAHEFIISVLLDGQVRPLHFLIFLGIALLTAIRTVQSAVFQALLLVRETLRVRIVSSLVQLILIIVLVWIFGLTGFFVSIAIGLSVAVLSAWAITRSGTKIRYVMPRPKTVEGQGLLQFGALNIALLILAITSENVQRITVAQKLGIEEVGLMVAGLQIVTYLDVANRSALFYWLPKFSRTPDPALIRGGFSEYSHFNLYLGIPAVWGGIIFGGPAIHFLLGDEFAPLTGSFYLFMIWQFITLIHNPPAIAIVALGRLRPHAAASILSGLAVPVTLYLLIDRMGFSAIGVAFIIGGVMGWVPRALYLGYSDGLWGDRRTWLLVAVGIAGIVVSLLMREESSWIRIVVWTLMATIAIGFATKSERNQLIDSITFGRLTKRATRSRS